MFDHYFFSLIITHTHSIIGTMENVKGHRIGFPGEMRVLADLMLKGYEVYGAYRVGNRFDFVIAHQDKFYTVEVKVSPKFKFYPLMRKTKPDILVLINHEGQIKYLDKLPNDKNNP
jgi:hypothetical protein